MLTRDQARQVYDRIGKRLDSQAFYEDRASELLIQHGEFAEAQRIFEFGCGTGRLAHRLLSEQLPESAIYRAVDLSPVMVRLTRELLARFGKRVEVDVSSGDPAVKQPSMSSDRFVSTFVLDLLPEDDIAAVVREAHRILQPGGFICLASLSRGSGPASRLVAKTWSAIHDLCPVLVGGCRPLELLDWFPAPRWKIRYHDRVAPFWVPLEVVVAERV